MVLLGAKLPLRAQAGQILEPLGQSQGVVFKTESFALWLRAQGLKLVVCGTVFGTTEIVP